MEAGPRGVPVTGEVLWRLCRPVVLLAAVAAVCTLAATTLIMQLPMASWPGVGIVAALVGGALLASVLCLVEFYLALRCWHGWSAGTAPRCRVCGWPVPHSIVLQRRCVNPVHDRTG